MLDDPLEILGEAGIDPVDFALVAENLKPQRIIDRREDCAMCALQRIARLAAKLQQSSDKYKWQRDDMAAKMLNPTVAVTNPGKARDA